MARYVPKEHGGWSILILSFLMGVLLAGRWHFTLPLLLAMVIAGYCLRTPLLAWIQRRRRDALYWCLIYLGVASISAISLVWHPARRPLGVALAITGMLLVVMTWLASKKLQRSTLAEFLGIGGLTLAGPIGYYGALGDEVRIATLLWVLNALFFGSSVYYVKMRLEFHLAQRRGIEASDVPYRRSCLIYHVMLFVIVTGFCLGKWLPVSAALAFGLLLMRWWPIRGRRQLSFRQLGFRELGMSIAYALWVVWGL